MSTPAARSLGPFRGEGAAIAYRVMTADVGDENVGLYANMTTPFTDVGNKWWTPYINYAWNAQIIVGDGNGHFFPDMEINGYQVLAILLRMIGYNQPGEFEGKGWELHTAQIAAQLHVSDNLTSALSAKTPRQEVAQMVYNAVQTPQVTWTPAGGYSQSVDMFGIVPNPKLIDWDITSSLNTWGAPSKKYINVSFNYANKEIDGDDFTIPYPALYISYDAVTECDVADELGFGGTGSNEIRYATSYTNGKYNVNLGNNSVKDNAPMMIEALDTVNKIGHEGRLTRIYANPDFNPLLPDDPANPRYIITFVDTFLGDVIETHDAVTDPAGHIMIAAGGTVRVYTNTGAVGSASALSTAADGRRYIDRPYTGTGYSVGDKLAVNVATVEDTNIMSQTGTRNSYNSLPGAQVVNKAATSQVTVTVKEISRSSGATAVAQQIVGLVSDAGTQYYYNYTFAGTPLNNTEIGKTYTLYLDSEGNILDYVLGATSGGYGVTLKAKVNQISTNEWSLIYTILTPDETEIEIEVIDANTGKPFTTPVDAQNYANKDGSRNTTNGNNDASTNNMPAGTLVHYTALGNYYVFKRANDNRWLGENSSKKVVEPGRAEALYMSYLSHTADTIKGTADGSTLNGALVNDNTVFFVAEYA